MGADLLAEVVVGVATWLLDTSLAMVCPLLGVRL